MKQVITHPTTLSGHEKKLPSTTIVQDEEFTLRSLSNISVDKLQPKYPWWHNLKYLFAGTLFGIVFVKAELISWFRMQEMFRLQSFHMYGVMASAMVVSLISVWLIKRFNIKTMYGEKVEFPTKKFNKGQVYGGLLFGFGWAITGACPGPLFAQIGAGFTIVSITLLSAIAGTWVYGYFRDKLSH
jgi:uncharacterized membrane protein YedE/YeeE